MLLSCRFELSLTEIFLGEYVVCINMKLFIPALSNINFNRGRVMRRRIPIAWPKQSNTTIS